MTLNDSQREAVNHQRGHVVVFASAGSGKTRIITARLAALIESGVQPRKILAVTFTNRAAKEMRERAQKLEPTAKYSVISTFHSACARWLREFAGEMKLDRNFAIYDKKDSDNALRAVLFEKNVELTDHASLSDFSTAISKAKTAGIFATDIDKIKKFHPQLFVAKDFNVYQHYQNYLRKCNAVDFGDLILHIIHLLRNSERVKLSLQRRFEYIMVDEYQDINSCQFELVQTISEGYHNLFVVGDDDQSIYSWRGADPHNILQFHQVFPQAKTIVLNQNYRSSATIVNAASSMVKYNYNRVDKDIWTDNPTGDVIDFRQEPDPEIEAHTVVDMILAERFPFHEIAIFYRTNSQSRVLEDKLRRQLIPYRIFGGVRFYDRVEIKDVLAYFRLAVNNNDNASFKRIANVPRRGLGDQTLRTIEDLANRERQSMLQQTRDLAIQNYPKIGKKLRDFVNLFNSLESQLLNSPLAKVMEIFYRHVDYFDYLAKKYRESAEDRRGNVIELGSAIADYSKMYPDATLDEWLQAVTLAGDEDDSFAKDYVSLMTLHSAKGLEFDRAFIVGVEENLLPHFNSINAENSSEEIEEERRLFYVGMTRAKVRLTLLAANRRENFGEWKPNRPSRFLSEIPSRYLFSNILLREPSSRPILSQRPSSPPLP